MLKLCVRAGEAFAGKGGSRRGFRFVANAIVRPGDRRMTKGVAMAAAGGRVLHAYTSHGGAAAPWAASSSLTRSTKSGREFCLFVK